jgi:hypothetical protein
VSFSFCCSCFSLFPPYFLWGVSSAASSILKAARSLIGTFVPFSYF